MCPIAAESVPRSDTIAIGVRQRAGARLENTMNENPDTTGCEGGAVRPTKRDMIPMMGVLVAAFPVAQAKGSGMFGINFAAELWFATGSEADPDGTPRFQIFHFNCATGGTAIHVAKIHRAKWGVPVYTTLPCDFDGIPTARLDGSGWDPIV